MKNHFSIVSKLFLHRPRLLCIISLLLVQFISIQLHAQTTDVKGKVTDSVGTALSGVSVQVQGTGKGVVTNASGDYSLKAVSSTAMLTFSYVGFTDEQVAVNGRTKLDVVMHGNARGLNEVVVTGYASQRKKDITGAVATLEAEKIADLPTTNLSNSLAGRISGMYVMQSTGVPGITADVRIRSGSSWNEVSTLYVIDGVVRDKNAFDMIDPSEVADISVLKDAASAAIYGSRSAGGVILVTTKRGRNEKPVISYSGSYSFDKPTSLPKIMDPVTEGVPFINRAFPDPSSWEHWSDEEMAALKQRGWINHLDDVYRTPNISRHTLNVSGGNDKVNYFIGGSYVKQNGYLPQLSYQKYNLIAKVEGKISNSLTASLNLRTDYDLRSTFNWNADGYDLNSLWAWLIGAYGTIPSYIDGKPTDNGWVANLTDRFYQGYSHYSGQYMDAIATLQYDVPFIKGLSVKAIFSKNDFYGYNKRYDVNHLIYQFKPIPGSSIRFYTDTVLGSRWSQDPGIEYLENDWNRSKAYQLNGQATYVRDMGKHHLDAFFVYEQSEWNNNSMNGKRKDFPVVQTDQFWATSSDTKSFELNGGESLGARLSFVGKVNYAYANKYLLSASVRRDGSLNFAPTRRWGTFPAVSAGWVLSEENFLKNKSRFLDYLKLRASYGVTGNDAVGGWQWQDQYYLDQTYVLGSQVVRGVNRGGNSNGRYYNVSNNNLTWEQSTSYNFGFDAQLFHQLSISTNYWFRYTTDILGSRTISFPFESGIYLADQNYGKVNSHGYEVELTYNGKAGKNFRYYVRGNLAYATNKVIRADVAENAQWVDNPNGKPLGYLIGLKSTGVIRTQADLAKLPSGYTINGYQPQLGMLNFEDISGPDGHPDGKIDSYDRTVIADHSDPSYTGGLTLGGSWKGLNVEVFLQGNLGGHKLFYDGTTYRQADTYDMPWKFWLDSWTPQNPKGKYPQQIEQNVGVQNSDVVDSDFWLFNTSYVRLKQITLGYTLPLALTKKAGINNVKFFLSGTNLLTWSKMKLYDPELATYSSYPIMKTYTLGLNITL